jgi:adenylosuccinate lyase
MGQKFSPWLSEGGIIRMRVRIEIDYLLALSKKHIIRTFTAQEKKKLQCFQNLKDTELLEIKKIEKTTRHDIAALISYLRKKLSDGGFADVNEYIHFGLTSEDINNLAWRVGLSCARDRVLIPFIRNLIRELIRIAEEYKSTIMLARTHGQAAIPTTFGKEIINVAVRLSSQEIKLKRFCFLGKTNGAVGNLSSLAYVYPRVDWITFFNAFVRQLGMKNLYYTTQVNPNDDIVEYLQIMERINVILHAFAGDMWRYISDGLVIQKAAGIGSSTMPQKINPIDFEHSEGVTEIANGLLQVLCEQLPQTRLSRDLSDTPLFRYLGEIHAATADALFRITESLKHISFDGKLARKMVWENLSILSEPLQLLLKKAQMQDAYTTVRKYTQGKQFSKTSWKELIDLLIRESGVTDNAVIIRLTSLSPDTYIGEASRLVDKGIREIKKTE